MNTAIPDDYVSSAKQDPEPTSRIGRPFQKLKEGLIILSPHCTLADFSGGS